MQTSFPTPTFEAVTRLAHELWEQQGRPGDRAREHWFEAERRAWAAAQRAAQSEMPPPTSQEDPRARLAWPSRQ